MGCIITQERYTPRALGADSVTVVPQQSIGGFLAKTSGFIAVEDSLGVLLVDEVPVTAGVFTRIPAYLGQNGGTVTLSGGASGTLFV